MHEGLKNIIDFVENKNQLSADEKKVLLQSVKSVASELEITAFKLERTEQVKKTTAILLEETIEELEQKRKAVESQNRILEIEAALERVRSIAMGMKEPGDMLEVCRTISLQLESLGVNEIRNVQTAIFKEHNQTYMNYEYYARHNKTFITEATYSNHKIHHEFAIKMLKGKGEFFITSFRDREVKDWIAYQKTTNVFIDEYLETASSLNYYWFSLGPVALGISTYLPLTEEDISLFKRFLKVFELAYRRYNDITLAEAQAREAQIELALERVRARTMAMHKSEELVEASDVLFTEIEKLGIKAIRTGIALIDGQKDTVEVWSRSEMRNQLENKILGVVPASAHPLYEGIIKAWKEKQPYFSYKLEGDDLVKYYQKLSSYLSYPNRKKFNKRETIATYFFPEGSLNVISNESLDYEQNEIIIRFARVFGQLYRRFLDLQKAEAQAREAEIELALERVRAKTMAMQKSEELKEVIQLVYEQFVHLNIHIEHTGFIMDYKARDDMHIWLADRHEVPSEITIPYFDSPHWNSFNEAKEKGMDFFANHLTFEEKNRFYQDLFKLIPGVPQETLEYYFSCPGLAISTVLLENVGLYIENFSGNPYSDEENNTLMRFGKVFQQTYTRFLDLQKAEAQAREAKIEASLERVRARAMAMHSSDDLALTVDVFFKELKLLHVTPRRCGVTLIDEGTHIANLTVTTATAQGEDLKMTAKLKLAGHPVLEKVYENWKQQLEYHPVLKGSEIKDYYQSMNPEIAYPDFPDAIQYGHYFFFNEGGVFAWTDKELVKEDLEIFRRFTSVLSLTYRRYIDLKNAEAQNIIIQAENERKTRELEEARQLQLAMLPKEVPRFAHLDIAVYMKTATEVGGDYYDFSNNEDGSLNICLGDATGHGMKAGIMVSSMKSIFTTNASKMDIENFFATANSGVKSMNLRRMMMGFTMLNINYHHFRLINAGMPPVFLYRKKQKSVKEIKEHGMPIGAMTQSRYNVIDQSLGHGDVLLLLTDGMPELQNENNELYGYQRLRKCFTQIAENEPQDIIEHLKNTASQWVNDKDPEDDVTFVVIKVK